MIVTIWRHGTAEEGFNDRLRQLTNAGRSDVAHGSRQFQQACHNRAIPPVTHMLYSPWERTQQTAEIIAAALECAHIASESALRPGSDLPAVENLVASIEGDHALAHVLLVSHQPLVSRLVEHWLGHTTYVPSLPPGGLATLSLDIPAPSCGDLLFWAFPPAYEVAR